MQSQAMEVMAVSAHGPEVSSVKHEGILHAIIPFTRAITPVQDLLCLIRLVKLIRTFKPQIVHSHTPKAGLLGMLAAWLCRVPIRLHTVAGLPLMEAKGIKRWILQLSERVTYACATQVYPNSRGLMDFIRLEVKTYISKLKIIGKGSSNGIDLRHFDITSDLKVEANRARERFKIEDDEFVFCFVGRVVRDKGLMELIQAFLKIYNSGTKVKLLLVGHFEDDLDPLPKEIREIIDTHDGVVQVGFQSDVRPWIIASDAMVLPSYREGFPNVLLQAGALQRPCIATDINGCNEIILDGKTGWLVPAKDSIALQAAMERVLSDRGWRAEAGREARKFIAENFEQSYVWSEILKEYKRLLSNVS